MSLTVIFKFKLLLIVLAKDIDERESIPISKNELVILMLDKSKIFFKHIIIILSISFLGFIIFLASILGKGNDFLSTLPFIFKGSLSREIMCDGII